MKFSIKKALLSGLLTVSVLASSLIAAIPVAAANSSLTIESKSVANDAQFTLNVTAATTVVAAGAGAIVTFNPAILRADSAAYNTPGYFGASQFNVTAVIDNGAGTVVLTSTNGGGAAATTGTGLWANITFTALTDNTTAVVGFVGADSYLANSVPAAMPTDLVVANLIIGQPPIPDLTVANVGVNIIHAGTSATIDPTTYTVSFQVNNVGDLVSGACTASVVVDATTTLLVSVPAILSGANSGTLTSGEFTFGLPLDSIVVTADSTMVITEGNEANNAGNTLFSFQYPVPGQVTDVDGGIVGTISFTNPANLHLGNDLQIGPDNTVSGGINVISNQSWTISAQGLAPVTTTGAQAVIDAGKMTKLTGTTYDPYVKLHRQLHAITSGGYLTPFPVSTGTIQGTNANVTLSGDPQVLAFGIPEGQVTDEINWVSLGEDRTLTFQQTILASDAHLASPAIYDLKVNFTIAPTAW